MTRTDREVYCFFFCDTTAKFQNVLDVGNSWATPKNLAEAAFAEGKKELCSLTAQIEFASNTRGGTQTRNLLLRREAPYPLGHTSI